VDLKEELEEVTERSPLRIECDLDRFSVVRVIPVRGIGDIAAGVPHPCDSDSGQVADEILHAPKAPSSQNGRLQVLGHRYLSFRGVKKMSAAPETVFKVQRRPERALLAIRK
jgi:hypothetical protein